VDARAQQASTPRDVVAASDIVFYCIRDPQIVSEVGDMNRATTFQPIFIFIFIITDLSWKLWHFSRNQFGKTMRRFERRRCSNCRADLHDICSGVLLDNVKQILSNKLHQLHSTEPFFHDILAS
jgi:hypothetical protein